MNKTFGKRISLFLIALIALTSVNASVMLSFAQNNNSVPVLRASILQSEYLLGSGDLININDEIMGKIGEKIRIMDDGSIHLPLIGKIYISGLSVSQANQHLNQLYAKYYVNPAVTLQIDYQRPVRVYINGAVKSPGTYVSGKNLTPGSSERLGTADTQAMYYRLYLTDALILAGGLNYDANTTDIVVQRAVPRPQTIHVNLMDLFKNGNIIQDMPLRDQDIVKINRIPKEQLVMDAEWKDFFRSNLTESEFEVNVVGAVNKPGNYNIKPGESIFKAIAEAGDFTSVAKQKEVYILRSNSAGQVFRLKIDLDDKVLMNKQDFGERAQLLPGDLVLVPESTKKKWLQTGQKLLPQATAAALLPFFNNLIRFNLPTTTQTCVRRDAGGGCLEFRTTSE